MPRQDKLLDELKGEQNYGVFLMLQMDGVPETLQLVIATTEYDAAAGGLRDRGQYIIRAIGVREHRISVGMFGSLRFIGEHPLLFQYNTTPTAVFFKGQPDNVSELVLDIHQAHATTFGPWRHFPQYINVNQPLVDLLNSGGGLLGEMPAPLAERMAKVLAHHGLEHKLIEGESPEQKDEHGRSRLFKLLTIDDSYVVALDFSVEELRRS